MWRSFQVSRMAIRLQRALGAPGIRLMSVAQAEAIAKTVPGLKHVVLWRGLIDLSRDIPNSDVDLLASRNRVLVRKDLHPALQYLLLEAMREVHWPAGPFNRLGEFPAEQPNDLPLSPTAEAFYRSGPTFWQRYTSFWLTSLLNRIVFFVIPVVLALNSCNWLRASRLSDGLHIRRSQNGRDQGGDVRFGSKADIAAMACPLPPIAASIAFFSACLLWVISGHVLKAMSALAPKRTSPMREEFWDQRYVSLTQKFTLAS